MGNSRTGSHADGLDLYHPHHAFPPALRAAWPVIRERLLPPGGAPDPVSAARGSVRPGLRRVLAEPRFLDVVERAARDLRVDEADAAAVAASTPDAEEAAVRERVRLWLAAVRALHQEVTRVVPKPRASTRLALRAHVLAAVARLDDGPDARTPARTWVKTAAARRFWRRVAAAPWTAGATRAAGLVES